MKVEIDDKSGFCFGVVGAITAAERAIAGGEPVWSLGDIVHNRMEVQRLEKVGLKPLQHSLFPSLKGGKIVIRAHGEPPSVYRTARENGVEIIDATCPVVAKLQKTVREAHRQMSGVGGQVVILGKRGHPEVTGLTGQLDGDAVVIESEKEIDAVDAGRPVYLLSQTTQSLPLFERIGRAIRDRAADPSSVIVHDTICRQVANREQHLEMFARRWDVVIFVSGLKSSNGRVLFEVCREANPRSYMVEDPTGLRPEWFAAAESVGVCGATSTPKWLMAEVADAITAMGES